MKEGKVKRSCSSQCHRLCPTSCKHAHTRNEASCASLTHPTLSTFTKSIQYVAHCHSSFHLLSPLRVSPLHQTLQLNHLMTKLFHTSFLT